MFSLMNSPELNYLEQANDTMHCLTNHFPRMHNRLREILDTFSHLKCVLLTSPLNNSRGTGGCEQGLSPGNLRCYCGSCASPAVTADVYKGPSQELLTRGLGLNTMLTLLPAVGVLLGWFPRWRYNLKNKPSSGAKVSALQFLTSIFFISNVAFLLVSFVLPFTLKIRVIFPILRKTIKSYKQAWWREVQNPSVVWPEYWRFSLLLSLVPEGWLILIYIYLIYLCIWNFLFHWNIKEANILLCLCMCVYTCIYTYYIYIYVCVHIYICTYIYIYIYQHFSGVIKGAIYYQIFL